MKITVLDGYTLSPVPEENPWDELAALGELTVYDRTNPEDIVPRAKGADILFTNKTVLDRETIFALPKLKFIGVLATGFNIVDIDAARERGIPVSNVPTYGTDAVAQITMAMMLELCHHVGEHSRSVFAGDWQKTPDYSYWKYPLIELRGKTFGVVGFSRIGKRAAELARAFGMDILANTLYEEPRPGYEGFAFCGLEELLEKSDFVSLHCPLTPENVKMVNAERLSRMKKTAFLLNTARGALVDEEALAAALNSGAIAGAALDVLSAEPPSPDNPLLKAKNLIITPHIAWATLEARRRLMSIAAENARAFIAGAPVNVVNPGGEAK